MAYADARDWFISVYSLRQGSETWLLYFCTYWMNDTAVRDLLPPESYPLMTEVTSMVLIGGGDSETTFKREFAAVHLHIALVTRHRELRSNNTCFSFTHITEAGDVGPRAIEVGAM